MSDEDEEYEIEAILEARVKEVGKGRKRELTWEFLVRWKDYSPEHDSWEPLVNLESGSQEALSHFLGRINTGGRDYRLLASFKAGETFLPVGPPKRPKDKHLRRTSGNDSVLMPRTPSETIDLSPPRTRKRDIESPNAEDTQSSKRQRSTFDSKPNLLLTDISSPTKANATANLASDLEPARRPSPPLVASVELEKMDDLLNFSDDTPIETSPPTKIVTPPSAKNAESSMPLHRARVAHPLVQQLLDEDVVKLQSQNQLKMGSKIAEPLPPPPPPRRRKPGPGRASDGLIVPRGTLLTVDKGKLKSVKGKRESKNFTGANSKESGMESVMEPDSKVAKEQGAPVEPPKPGELLRLAGLEPDSDGLAEHEGIRTEGPPLSLEDDTHQRSNANILPLAIVDSLFPCDTPETESNPAWKRSTIFGPLSLGADLTKSGLEVHSKSTPFQIRLDSTYSLSVLLVDDIRVPNFPILVPSKQDPPGKFYRGQFATDLLGTIRTKGSFAGVCLSPDSTNLHSVTFRQFIRRLSNDELFVAMVGQDLLAFCSSSNALFTQRLNIKPDLLSPNPVVVAHVAIDNYSAFADATSNADDTTWSQYILTAGDDDK